MNLTCRESQVRVVPELVAACEAGEADGEPRFRVTESLDSGAAESAVLKSDSAVGARG